MATTAIEIGSPGTIYVALQANNGSLSVQRQVGDDWVNSDRFTADGAWKMSLGPVRTRFFPEGGAVYDLHDAAGTLIEESL